MESPTPHSLQAPSWGAGVKFFRESRGMSQADLAKTVGCSQSAVSRLEKGRARHLPDVTRMRIARALHVDAHKLFPYEGDDVGQDEQEGDVA